MVDTLELKKMAALAAAAATCLWLFVKTYNYWKVHRVRVQKLRLSKSPQEGNTSELHQPSTMKINVPAYKALWLLKSYKQTLRTFETLSGARIVVEEDDFNVEPVLLTTNRSIIAIIGEDYELGLAESCINNTISSLTFKIMPLSRGCWETIKKPKNSVLKRIEMSTGTVIRSVKPSPTGAITTQDGYCVSRVESQDTDKASLFIFGREKDVLKAYNEIAKRSRPRKDNELSHSNPPIFSPRVSLDNEELCSLSSLHGSELKTAVLQGIEAKNQLEEPSTSSAEIQEPIKRLENFHDPYGPKTYTSPPETPKWTTPISSSSIDCSEIKLQENNSGQEVVRVQSAAAKRRMAKKNISADK